MKKLKIALKADFVVLGGGNCRKLRKLPHGVQLGSNENAFVGGFRHVGEIARQTFVSCSSLLGICITTNPLHIEPYLKNCARICLRAHRVYHRVKKRTTVSLPQELLERLHNLSRKASAPMAELFRRA